MTTEPRFHCLIPYNPAEAVSLKQAASLSGKSVTTVKNWCEAEGIGRQLGGGTWQVSVVALTMWLEDDHQALTAYLVGDRTAERVVSYFRRFNLECCPN